MHETRSLSLFVMIGLVAIGGIGGTVSRYLLGVISGEAYLMTVLVNISGCFCLGLILFSTSTTHVIDRRIQALLATGFFSSFTTYSTFIADIFFLTPMLAVLYIAISYLGGIAAIIVSRRVAFLLRGEVSGEAY